MLQTPDNARSRSRSNKPEMLPRLQTDPRIRLSAHVIDPLSTTSTAPSNNSLIINPVIINNITSTMTTTDSNNSSNVSPCKDLKKENKGFMTLAPRKRFQKALAKMNFLQKNLMK